MTYKHVLTKMYIKVLNTEWWEKIGKGANRLKFAVPSHSKPLRWEKIGKSCTPEFETYSTCTVFVPIMAPALIMATLVFGL